MSARPPSDAPRDTSSDVPGDESFAEINQGLIRLLVVAAVAGIAVGLVGGSFHWLLVHGGAGFLQTLAQWKDVGVWGLPGWLAAMAVVGVSVALARWLVTFAPASAGSGVQHVEAVMREDADPAPFKVLPIKFVGGLLAMVPGLALGREGPTIQMARSLAHSLARSLGLTVKTASCCIRLWQARACQWRLTRPCRARPL